jgi:hypothetical protein
MKMNNGIIASFLIAIMLVGLITIQPHEMDHDMDSMTEQFLTLKETIQSEHMENSNYRCCLEEPCTYCIEKTPGHGEGSTCHCLKDLVEGVHPCGECIGEILEGHGNPYLAKYFAKAIVEKTGEEAAIKRIIAEKYDISIEEQY